MTKKQPITLKEAREKDKLKQFIKEREKDAPGDAKRLDAAISSAVKGKKKATPKSSRKGSSDD